MNLLAKISVRDHPYVRGEYSCLITQSSIAQGSSLHTWGILFDGNPDMGIAGIIPTCVGNTRGYHQRLGRARDHPYMRGEYQARTPVNPVRVGSSLHAWGIRRQFAVKIMPAGIIPTCVGNTLNKRRYTSILFFKKVEITSLCIQTIVLMYLV